MKTILVVSILLLCSVSTFAQSLITGHVYDENKNPIPFANVAVLSCGDSTLLNGGVSDNGGTFRIEMSLDGQYQFENYLLRVSFVGYTTEYRHIPVRTSQNDSIVLISEPEVLSVVSVLGKQKLFTMKGSTLTANVEHSVLEKSGRLEDLLNKIPFVSGAGASYHVFGRGQATVYINGQKVIDDSELKSLLSADIKKVDVITNPGANYDGTTRSVIKIYTKPKQGDGFSISAYSFLYHTRKLSNNESISLKYRRNNVDWFGSFNYAKTQMKTFDSRSVILLKEPISSTINRNKIRYESELYSSNLGFSYSGKNDFNAGVRATFKTNSMTNTISSPEEQHYSGDAIVSGLSSRSVFEDSPKTFLVNGYVIGVLRKTQISFANDFLMGKRPGNSIYKEMDNEVNVATDNKYRYVLNSSLLSFSTPLLKGELAYGGEFSYTENKQSFRFSEENIETSLSDVSNRNTQMLLASYLSYERKIYFVTVYAGLRYEYVKLEHRTNNSSEESIESKSGRFYPTINLSLNPIPDFNVSIGYKETVRRPSYYNLNGNIQYQSRYAYTQGNPYLKEMNLKSVNALISYKKLRFIANYDIYIDDFANIDEQYKQGEEIVLTRINNIPRYRRMDFALSWNPNVRFYTLLFECATGKQFLRYGQSGEKMSYDKPYWSVSADNYFELPRSFNLNLTFSYRSSEQRLFNHNEQIWGNSISVSKSFYKNRFFAQLSASNLWLKRGTRTEREVNNVRNVAYIDNDRRNVSFLISYSLNTSRNKYSNKLKSDELRRY